MSTPRIVQPYPDNDQEPSMRTRHYSVVWAPDYNETEDHLARVQIIDGYSTFADVQKIIAVGRSITPSQVIVKNATLTGTTRNPV